MINYDEINAILNAMADDHMIEPIDDPDCHPMDYADVVGIFDEVYPGSYYTY